MSDPAKIKVRLKQQTVIPLDVQFSCESDQLICLLGPSGSGKTTVLRAIAGLYKTDYGLISNHDSIWQDSEKNIFLPPQQRKTGFVFQEYSLFPHLSARKNVMLGMQHLSASEQLQRSTGLLSMVNLDGLYDRLPSELSGGQRQRVALARALARKPSVLLLDEPFSSVDKSTRKKLMRELFQIRKQLHIPIILVTHDLDEARILADQLCIIHHGETLGCAPPDEILTKPDSPKIARLVGQTNIFQGVISEQSEERNLTCINWHNTRLETAYHPRFEIGKKINWFIPADSIILHRHDRPSAGERENPVSGKVEELLPTGEMTHVIVSSQNNNNEKFSMTLPTHVARRNNISCGSEIKFSLLKDAIHLMGK